MHKEHIVNMETGLVAYRDTHTTPGRLAYIPEYRKMGRHEWSKIYKAVYVGRHYTHSTKEDELKKYGLLVEHYEIMALTLTAEIKRIEEDLKSLQNDLGLVSDCSQWLIEERIREVQAELSSARYSLSKYEKGAQ